MIWNIELHWTILFNFFSNLRFNFRGSSRRPPAWARRIPPTFGQVERWMVNLTFVGSCLMLPRLVQTSLKRKQVADLSSTWVARPALVSWTSTFEPWCASIALLRVKNHPNLGVKKSRTSHGRGQDCWRLTPPVHTRSCGESLTSIYAPGNCWKYQPSVPYH